MHYCNFVIIEPDGITNVEQAVERAMGPSEENGGFWDWYQIGGRYTGALDGYDPEKDARNIEQCPQCNGSGERNDAIGMLARAKDPAYKCNGCAGEGKHAAWPTKWALGDIAPIESLTEENYKCYRVVTPWARVHGGENYLPWKPVGEMFPRNEMPPLDWLKKEYAGHYVVVVDNHS